MVNRFNSNVARKNKKLNEFDSFAKQTASPLPASSALTNKREHSTDDIIVMLAEAYENKRARQVFEWERAQVRNVNAV